MKGESSITSGNNSSDEQVEGPHLISRVDRGPKVRREFIVNISVAYKYRQSQGGRHQVIIERKEGEEFGPAFPHSS